jgi:hypothetical protein
VAVVDHGGIQMKREIIEELKSITGKNDPEHRIARLLAVAILDIDAQVTAMESKPRLRIEWETVKALKGMIDERDIDRGGRVLARAILEIMDGMGCQSVMPPSVPEKSRMIPLVYIAGAYSSDSIDGVRTNIKMGLDLTAEAIRRLECTVYSPWLDWDLYLHYDFTVSQMKRSSMGFLERATCVLVQPVGYRSSEGTMAEIRRAEDLGIAVFYNIVDAARYIAKNQSIPSGVD